MKDLVAGRRNVAALLLVLLAALFPAAVALHEKGASAVFTLLALAGLVIGIRRGFMGEAASDRRRLVLVFMLVFAIAAASYLIGEASYLGWKKIGRHLRLLAFVPLLAALMYARPSPRLVWLALGLGAVASGAIALYQFVFQFDGQWQRIGGSTHPMWFGGLAAGLGFMAAAGLARFRGTWNGMRWLLVAGLAMSLVAVVLSGTRGAIIALPVLAVLLVPGLYRHFPSWRMSAMVGLLAVLVLAGLVVSPVGSRFSGGVDQLRHYTAAAGELRTLSVTEGCVDRRAVLEAIALEFDHPPHVSVSVTGDGKRLAAASPDCDHGFAFEARTPAGRSATVSLPWLGDGEDAILLLRRESPGGDGPVSGSSAGESAAGYQPVRFPVERGKVVVDLPAGEIVRLVPVQESPGSFVNPFLSRPVPSRLEMWRAAWRIFEEHPLVGAGIGAYRLAAADLVNRGEAPPIVARYNHPHNEYLSVLASRGLVGFVGLIALFGVPLLVWVRAWKSERPAARAAGLAGILLVADFAVLGLTEGIFDHSLVITYYSFFTALLASVVWQSGAADGPVP